MATRLKTVNYAFTTLASVTSNTLTNFTQLTINLPETGTKTFKSVILTITADDIITATGGSITTKTVGFRLNTAAYTSIANANILSNSAENISFCIAQDFTTHFQTNWTGTSRTCDVQVQFTQSTGTTPGFVNVCATLEITYEYDDTSATQVKTVFIPLNGPVGTLTTAAVTYDTIPALSTYLPESTKVFRNIYLVLQGNQNRGNVTTDHTITLRAGTANITTGNYEGALASDRFYRYVWNLTSTYPNTAATQTFQASSTVARCTHPQAFLVVTYEYREDLSTSIMNSLMLPMDIDSPFGGPAATDYQRANRDLWIQEPGTIGNVKIAFYCFWTQIGAIAGLNFRIGTGTFIAYSDTAAVLCGNNAAMIRNDSAITLTKGRNTLNVDAYRTDTADYCWNAGGFWIVNYSSDKAAAGSGSHNHTIVQNIFQFGTSAAAYRTYSNELSFQIPENDYFITAFGTRMLFQSTSTVSQVGYTIQTQRMISEGGHAWELAYKDISQTDSEVGVYQTYSQMRSIFKRYPTDNFSDRLDLETDRAWVVHTPAAGSTAGVGWPMLSMFCTYHTLSYNVSGTISGFSGTVTLELFRESTSEKLKEITRSGDGAFTFPWYDNTETVFVTATDGILEGCTISQVAGNTFDITAIVEPVTSGPTYFAY